MIDPPDDTIPAETPSEAMHAFLSGRFVVFDGPDGCGKSTQFRRFSDWAQALGVDCSHCHNTSNWASDEKPQKEIARQMVNMGELINAELRKIPGLKSERPTVNCISCHRGALKPALRMSTEQ